MKNTKDFTADDMRELSQDSVSKMVSLQASEDCLNFIAEAMERVAKDGGKFIVLQGMSPNKSFIPLFDEHKNFPLMTEKVRDELISRRFDVRLHCPIHLSIDDSNKSAMQGLYVGAVTISWQ